MSRRETRGRLFSGQKRERRDDVLGVLRNVQGNPYQYLGLTVPAVPTVAIPTVTKIEESPVATTAPALNVPSVPSRGGLIEMVMSFTSVMDCFDGGKYRKENETGTLRWPCGGVFGKVPEWGSFAGRYPGIYSLYKRQYVYF